MRPTFNHLDTRRERTGFHASDYGKLEADILCELRGIEPTNPKQWHDKLKFYAGNAVEEGMIEILKENFLFDPTYDQATADPIIVRKGNITITHHLDGKLVEGKITGADLLLPQDTQIETHDGEPLEIKSVNNKNFYDIKAYEENRPKENYVGQLAGYMQACGKKRGHLFVAAIDGLSYFWFVCEEQPDGTYKCGDTVVDLNKEHARWARIWEKFQKNEEPDFFEEQYKLPIEEIDWTKLSKSKIGDVRNGRYVVGSENKWRIDYSPWKDLILKKQGVSPGYSEEELEIIRAKTAGFSSKKTDVKDTPSVN